MYNDKDERDEPTLAELEFQDLLIQQEEERKRTTKVMMVVIPLILVAGLGLFFLLSWYEKKTRKSLKPATTNCAPCICKCVTSPKTKGVRIHKNSK